MEIQRTLELARQFAGALHAVDRRDQGALDAMVALFSPRARLVNAALKLAGEERTGEAGARAFWEQYQGSFQESATEFFQLTGGEQAAGLFWTTRGRDAAGEPLEYDGVTLLVFAHDGKIELLRGYYDTRELTRHARA